MNRLTKASILLSLLTFCCASAPAAQKLGDLVSEVGKGWVIGHWTATTDQGGKIHLDFDWALDRHAILTDIRMGDYQHRGVIALVPGTEDLLDAGADNHGGTTKGTWYEEEAGLVNRVERTDPEGEVQTMDFIYNRAGADAMTVALYGVDAQGRRSEDSLSKLTYRRTEGAGIRDAAVQSSPRTTDHASLGDLMSENGYEWLLGKWKANRDGRVYELEYEPILDRHAVATDVRIGDFHYRGLVVYAPHSFEVRQAGADSLGGLWKGTWDEAYEGAVNRIEYTRPDGTVQRMEHVYRRVDDDTFKVEEYALQPGGYRASSPQGTLRFERQQDEGG